MCLFVDDVSLVCLVVSSFFFFKQKTAYEMRISDWSSDVCSSDLFSFGYTRVSAIPETVQKNKPMPVRLMGFPRLIRPSAQVQSLDQQIGRASCRERVCQYV